MLPSTAVRSSSSVLFEFQYHEPWLSFCWFRLACTLFNRYNGSTKHQKTDVFEGCESRVNNLQIFTVYSCISQHLRHAQYSTSFSHHGLCFWIPMAPCSLAGLEILATKVTKEAWSLIGFKLPQMLHGAGISTYIYSKNGPNVGKSSIHGGLTFHIFAGRCIGYGRIRINTRGCIQTSQKGDSQSNMWHCKHDPCFIIFHRHNRNR